MEINGTAVLVTGAASGLGAATAARFARSGATVIGLDLKIPEDQSKTEAAGIRLFAADVTSNDDVRDVLDSITESGVPLRAAVNCAGVGWAQRLASRHGAHDLGMFNKVMDVNVTGTFNVMRLVADHMRHQEAVDVDGQRGVIINTASVAAFEGQIGQIAYAASKGAITAMTLPASRDLAVLGIRVCAIAPGTVDTPMLGAVTPEVRDSLAASIPFPSRLGRPDEYAHLAAFIVDHDYLNGETIRMDGALRLAPR